MKLDENLVTEMMEGYWFQVNVCTHQAISSLEKKEYLFPIPVWVSVSELIERLDTFI